MTSTRAAEPVGQGPAEPEHQALVVFDSSRNGRAALRFADALTAERQIALTVLAVTPQERVDVGCARCRHSAGLWNREMAKYAREELTVAAAAIDWSPARPVRYMTGRGEAVSEIAGAARRAGAELIIVPFEPPRRLGFLPRRTLARRLRGHTELPVLTASAPAAAQVAA